MTKKIEDVLKEVETDEVVGTTEKKVKENVDASGNTDFDASADIEAIFGGMELSEDFKEKAKRVYEASVVAMATQISEKVASELNESFEAQLTEKDEELDETFKSYKNELNENVNDYLGVVTEGWLNDNKLEATNIVRTEIAESFMEQMKTLMAEHYVDVPTEKVNLINELQEQAKEAIAEQNRLMEEIVNLRKENNAILREAAIAKIAEGLTEMEKDKFTRLSEAVNFSDNFEDKLTEIRESYFVSLKEATGDTGLENDDPVVLAEEVETPKSKIVRNGIDYTQVLKHMGKTSRVVPVTR